jgi:[amino group carrier protein]-L-2-aminoadipate 6-kinase
MTIVVKVGGAAGNEVTPLVADLAGRADYVVVHGGSDRVDRLGAALGRPSEYLTSPSGVVSRRNDPAHLEVAVLALAGGVQTDLVAAFARHGVRALGLSGVDGGLVLARRKEGVRAVVDGRVLRVSDDWSGAIERVDAELLRGIARLGVVPIVGPPAVTARGEVVNVDADRIASAIAVALRAEALVLLSNVPGLLRDPHDPASLVRAVPRAAIDSVLPLAEGRMRKKVLAARDAVEGGVGRAVIGSSRLDAPVGRALAGEGTVFE